MPSVSRLLVASSAPDTPPTPSKLPHPAGISLAHSDEVARYMIGQGFRAWNWLKQKLGNKLRFAP